VVVDVEKIRREYHRIEDRLYRLRCSYGYSPTRNQAFRRLEDRARRLNRIVRQMETQWGTR